MRVVLLPSWYNSRKAPARGSFVTDQALALAALGHEVTVIAFDRDAPGPLLAVRHSLERGIPHIRIAVPAPWHRLLGFYFPRVLARIVAKLLRELRSELLHAHAVRPAGVVGLLAAREAGIPHCLTEHSGPLRKFWFTRHGWRQIGRAFDGADRLFAVSDSLRQEMLRWFPAGAARAEILYNGIDLARFRLPAERQSRDGRLALLFVGGLVEEKGLPYLLDAVAQLPDRLKWSLSLVGVGPLEQSLRRQASRLGIDGRLRWIGRLPHDNLAAIYAEHDMLVVSSVVETFSLVSAEALACGLPVVATACGGPEEVLGPLGLPLVPPGDPAALASAIVASAAAGNAFDRVAAAQSIEARFSIEALAARLDAIYAALAQEKADTVKRGDRLQ